MKRYGVARLLAVLGLPSVLLAQGDCHPTAASNEARTFAILSVPLVLSDAGGGISVGGARLVAGIEGFSIPDVSPELATPTTCRPGQGPENTNPLPAAGRLRLTAAIAGLVVEVGWIPPLRLAGVRANLVGVGLGRPVPLGGAWLLLPRVHLLMGHLRAPITCDDDALLDPASECFGGTRSDDRWTPGLFGVDLALSRVGGTIRPHIGVGYTGLRPRFEVNFMNAQGETDRRRISVNLSRAALFAGVSATVGPVAFTFEGYATIGEPMALRVILRAPVIG